MSDNLVNGDLNAQVGFYVQRDELFMYHGMNFYVPRAFESKLFARKATKTTIKKWLRNFKLEHLFGIFEINETLM